MASGQSTIHRPDGIGIERDETTARDALVADALAALYGHLLELQRSSSTLIATRLERGSAELGEARRENAELRSMMQQLRRAFDMEKARAIEAAVKLTKQDLEDRERDVSVLQSELASKHAQIKQLQDTIAGWERDFEVKVRATKTDGLARERELQSEVTRTLGAREHLRFESEVMKNKLMQLESALRASRERDASQLETRLREQIDAFLESERVARRSIEGSRDAAAEAAWRTTHHVSHVHNKHQSARKAFVEQVFRAIGNVHLVDELFSKAAPDAHGVAQLDPPVYSALETMWNNHREHRLRLREERAAEAAAFANNQQAVAKLAARVVEQEEEMKERNAQHAEHISTLRERTEVVERQLQLCRQKVAASAEARASHRSIEHVVGDMLKEHAKTVDELHDLLAKSDEEKRQIAAVNKTVLYQQLSAKHELTTMQLERMTENFGIETKRRMALESALQVSEETSKRLLEETKHLRQALESLQSQHNATLVQLQSVEAVSRRDIDGLLEELDRVNALHREDTAAAQLLRDDFFALESKFKQQHALLQEAKTDATFAQRELKNVLASRIDEARWGGKENHNGYDDRAPPPDQPPQRLKGAKVPPPPSQGNNNSTTGSPTSSPQKSQAGGRGHSTAVVASHNANNMDEGPSTLETGEAAADAAIRHLDNLLLVARRENAVLRRRLDDAVAQASEAENRRCAAVERNLAMQARQDAAPRREANILQQQGELQKLEAQLTEREAALDRRQRELEVKERTIAGKLSLVTHGRGTSAGGLLLGSSDAGSPRGGPYARAGSLRDDSQSESNSVSTYTHKTPSTAGSPRTNVRLTPLALRLPPAPSPSTVPHPQKLPQPQNGAAASTTTASIRH